MRLNRTSLRRLPPTRGLTLIEVVAAILVFTVGALGLAAASATITRQLALNAQRGYVASIAGKESEGLHATACRASGSGSLQARGVRSSWTVERAAGSVELDHLIDRSTPFGNRQERFFSGVPCE